MESAILLKTSWFFRIHPECSTFIVGLVTL